MNKRFPSQELAYLTGRCEGPLRKLDTKIDVKTVSKPDMAPDAQFHTLAGSGWLSIALIGIWLGQTASCPQQQSLNLKTVAESKSISPVIPDLLD
ncbi:hypothetical protein CAP48_13215 [Advenella sp. S44]|nr:hypothetical protein CAP48_13215 [Advenella sp. S44]